LLHGNALVSLKTIVLKSMVGYYKMYTVDINLIFNKVNMSNVEALVSRAIWAQVSMANQGMLLENIRYLALDFYEFTLVNRNL
jgi:hypothetical protein